MSWSEIQAGPAFGLTVVGLIVVFGPLVAKRARLPGLLGLLIGGALIGPNMLNALPSFDALEAIGEIGVLYLIFLAGMQLDIESFIKYRRISVGFGLLTAFIPLVLGTAAALMADIDFAASLLIGSFWASFTLITYPTLSRYGLTRNRAVAATVGASSITDTISLILLALIIGAETGDSTGFRLMFGIGIGLVVLAAYCLIVVPWIARWFFAGVGQERTLRYMFVLISLTSAAVVADLVGIEPLLGAFFVGVGLNRIVPNASPLMSITDFFGNAFFIPVFLISVGLLFDPEVMFVASTLRLAVLFAVALIVGKAIAAWLSGRIFELTGAEVGLMFSVSVAQAAATLAATIIGLEAGLYGADVVNAVMVVVAVSLIMTSVGTSRYAPKITPPKEERRRVGEAILVPVFGSPEHLRNTFILGSRLAEPVGGALQPLVVAISTQPETIETARGVQASADEILSSIGQDVDTELRVDRSVASGLNRAAIQADSSMLLLGWPGPDTLRAWLFGSKYADIVAATSLPVIIAGLHGPTSGRVVILARETDLVPGDLPSLQLGSDIASMLLGHDESLVFGPLAPAAATDAGVSMTERVEYQEGSSDDIVEWAASATEPGDLVIIPLRDAELSSKVIEIFDSGRSVLAATHNPESALGLASRTMSLTVEGSIGAA